MEDLFEKKIVSYMKYIHNSKDFSGLDKVRFMDVSDSFEENIGYLKMHSYFCNEMCRNKERVLKIFEKYKDIYPKAYELVDYFNCIDDWKYTKYDEKMIILFKYISCDNVIIPSGRSHMRFSDIDFDSNDESYVGIWIQTQLEYSEKKFCDLCCKYQWYYPKGYRKMMYKLDRRDVDLLNRNRIQLLIPYLRENYLKYGCRFCDIGGDINDKASIILWIKLQLLNNKSFLSDVKRECECCHADFQVIVDRLCNHYINQNKYYMDENRKIELFLSYLETHAFPSYTNPLKFKDLDSSVLGPFSVMSWFNTLLKSYHEKDLDEMLCKFRLFKDKYPIGYSKVEQRCLKSISIRKMKAIPYDVKVRTVLKYLEECEDNFVRRKVKFSEVDETVLSDSYLRVWVDTELSFRLERLSENVENYKEVYPLGYCKMVSCIQNYVCKVKEGKILRKRKK